MDKLIEYGKELSAIIYGIFIFLEIDVRIVKVLFALMLVDTIFGVVKTIVLGKRFSLKILVLGMVSKLSVLLVPMVLALMSKGLNYDFKWFVNIVIDIMIVSDGISIFSNAIAIKTKKEVENFDVVTQLLRAIRTGLVEIFKKLIKKIEQPHEN